MEVAMRSSAEHDLREFHRRYAVKTDWAHRRKYGIPLSLLAAAGALAMAWRWLT